MVDDILADAMLHKEVVPGDIAFMDLSRRTGEPICQAKKPGEPLELVEAADPDEFTVVRAGQEGGGVNGDVLLAHAATGGSRTPEGLGSGEGSNRGAWVLATGGIEDLEGNSN